MVSVLTWSCHPSLSLLLCLASGVLKTSEGPLDRHCLGRPAPHLRLLLPCTCVLSRARLLVTPWTVVYRAPLSMEFFRQEYWHACVLSHFSHVQLSSTLWTVAHQAPLSRGFSRPEYWSGLPFPPPRDLPNPGI